MGCYGDGGAVFTNNDDYADLLRSYRSHGKGGDKYNNVRIGMNSRLDTIQAAILLEKLSIFPDELERRREVAGSYDAIFQPIVDCPVVPDGYKSGYAQYTVKAKNRGEVRAVMSEVGVPSVIYYERCLHQQAAFSYLASQEDGFINAEILSDTVLSIAIHPYLTNDEVASKASQVVQGFVDG